ncbi:SMR family transporter [Staphylococcus arlettae]|uniref:SMR family transporter n=1 Tax=Staphylococcus arlettae TaxID=29378 RepID=UPI0034638E83
MWAALGTAGTTLIGALFFNEILSVVNVIGIVVVITGVIIMNLDFTNNRVTHK